MHLYVPSVLNVHKFLRNGPHTPLPPSVRCSRLMHSTCFDHQSHPRIISFALMYGGPSVGPHCKSFLLAMFQKYSQNSPHKMESFVCVPLTIVNRQAQSPTKHQRFSQLTIQTEAKLLEINNNIASFFKVSMEHIIFLISSMALTEILGK